MRSAGARYGDACGFAVMRTRMQTLRETLSRAWRQSDGHDMNNPVGDVRILEWTEFGECFVSTSSGLLFGGRRGDEEELIFEELWRIVNETMALSHVNEGTGPSTPPASAPSASPPTNSLQEVA